MQDRTGGTRWRISADGSTVRNHWDGQMISREEMIRQQRSGVRKDGPKRATERSDRAKSKVSGQGRRTELGDIVGPTDRRHGQANHDDTDAISHLTQKANETWNDRATERRASENPEQVSSDVGMTTVIAEGPYAVGRGQQVTNRHQRSETLIR
jgi:hypothetical protein